MCLLSLMEAKKVKKLLRIVLSHYQYPTQIVTNLSFNTLEMIGLFALMVYLENAKRFGVGLNTIQILTLQYSI